MPNAQQDKMHMTDALVSTMLIYICSLQRRHMLVTGGYNALVTYFSPKKGKKVNIKKFHSNRNWLLCSSSQSFLWLHLLFYSTHYILKLLYQKKRKQKKRKENKRKEKKKILSKKAVFMLTL